MYEKSPALNVHLNKEFYTLMFQVTEKQEKIIFTFSFLFLIIHRRSLCLKVKNFRPTKLVHCRSISHDQQLFRALCVFKYMLLFQSCSVIVEVFEKIFLMYLFR